jgi:CheY-like chemotaxis protein
MSLNFSKQLGDWRHDLRTPAGHITGYAEMIEEELDGPEYSGLRGQLVAIRKSGETLVELIDEHLGPGRTSIGDIDFESAKGRLSEVIDQVKAECAKVRPALVAPDIEANLPDLDKIESACVRVNELLEGIEDGLRATGEDEPVSIEPEMPVSIEVGPDPLKDGGEILVVDDDAANRELLVRRLTQQGYQPTAAVDGETALQMLEAHPVELVLLDMMMPGLNGDEVLARLKSDPHLKHIPVVMLSALDDMKQIIGCISMGAEDYLFKPYDPVLLKARIGATLEKYRLRKQHTPRLKVFISSAGDVEVERRLAKRVITRLNDELSGRVYMVPVLWEDEPLVASETAQSQIVVPRDTDIYVAILWARMGTMLPDHIVREDGSRYDSGTEFEFEDAVAGHDEAGKPEILAYRKMADPMVSLLDRNRVLDSLDQRDRLEIFLRKWFQTNDGLSIARVYHAFEAAEQFEELLESHLRKLALGLVKDTE